VYGVFEQGDKEYSYLFETKREAVEKCEILELEWLNEFDKEIDDDVDDYWVYCRKIKEGEKQC